jgi:DNA-binding transcriptional MerR regulator
MTNRYAIGDVAEKTGVTVHTLRYYERIGLLAPVARSAGGRRAYDDGDVGWVQMLTLLRATGMGVRDMLAFAELTRGGPTTIPDRVDVLERHRAALEALMRRHTEHHQLISAKIATYRGMLGTTPEETL